MSSLSRIAAELANSPDQGALPVELWTPAHCGEMDLRIANNGDWIHEGSPIARPALVRLLSRVLRRDNEGYVLVTPAEKLAITVDDVPFIIVDIEKEEDGLRARSNVGDRVLIGPQHPLEMRKTPDGTIAPYIHLRGDLWGRVGRDAFYRLVNEHGIDQDGQLVVRSAGAEFSLGGLA